MPNTLDDFKVGQKVRVLDTCIDWHPHPELSREQVVLGIRRGEVFVSRPYERGGWVPFDRSITDYGWCVKPLSLEIIEDKPVKPFIPYPRTCKICKSPARKDFCSNRKCKSRKKFYLTLPRPLKRIGQEEDGRLMCLECDSVIVNLKYPDKRAYEG
jgi:hypothetical protein